MKLSPRYDGPRIITIDGRPGDQREPVIRQRRRLESLVSGLSAAEWQAPSRCEGWTNQDVVSHLVGVNTYWVASMAAGLAGNPTRVLATFDPAAHPALMVDSMRGLTAHEVLDQFAASNAAFLGAIAALDETGWETIAEAPPGHVSIRVLAHHALWDSWVHERDIALPLGRTQPEETDELQATLRYCAALGAALTVIAGEASEPVLGVEAGHPETHFALEIDASVAVRDRSPAADPPSLRGATVELIEALSVRGPLPADAPDEWRRALRGLETAFDAV